ncbi:MAG: alkaline phosphatase family protein [Crocinitomicaceae bacterium]
MYIKRIGSVFIALLLLTCSKTNSPIIQLKNDQKIGINKRKVLIVGWDGVRTDALAVADTKTLFTLTKEAIFSWNVDRGPFTVSVPGWSTLLHGVWPEKHGLTENAFSGNHYADYPDLFTLVKQTRSEFVTANLSNWDQFLDITQNENISIEVNSDFQLTQQTLMLLNSQTPDLTVLHYNDPDFNGHETGFTPDNPKYIKAIQRSDAYLTQLMELVRYRENRFQEEWMVIVTTDHGGCEGHHDQQEDKKETRFIWYVIRTPNQAPLNLTAEKTNLVDILPTLFEWLNIPNKKEWNLDGKVLKRHV